MAGEVEVAAVFLDEKLVVLDAEARGGVFESAHGGSAICADSDRFFAFFTFAEANIVDIHVIAHNLHLEDVFTSSNFAQFSLHGGISRPVFALFCNNAVRNGLIVDEKLYTGLFGSGRHLDGNAVFSRFCHIDGIFKPFAILRVA